MNPLATIATKKSAPAPAQACAQHAPPLSAQSILDALWVDTLRGVASAARADAQLVVELDGEVGDVRPLRDGQTILDLWAVSREDLPVAQRLNLRDASARLGVDVGLAVYATCVGAEPCGLDAADVQSLRWAIRGLGEPACPSPAT